MTSNHAKGKAKEREFLFWIARQTPEHKIEGFVYPMGKFSDCDAHGVFDGHYLTSAGAVVFFQVCHRSTIARHRRAIEAFVASHPARQYVIALYAWQMGKDGFRQVKAW